MFGCRLGLIILGQDHVNLLGTCSIVRFRILINLSNQFFGQSSIDLNIVGTDSHVAPPIQFNRIILSYFFGRGNVNRETEHDLLQGTLAGKEYKMKKHITDEKTRMSYTLCGDYYLPDLKLKEQEEAHYGKYGMLRKSFLKEHRPGLYFSYLLTGKLTAHLNEVDQQANERMKMLVDQMMERQAITEELKVRDQMEWVGAVNNIRNAAEEIVLNEIVYCINN